MTKQTYRFIILLLTGLLALVITWGVTFSQNNSEELVLPASLENIYPLPNDQVPQQVSVQYIIYNEIAKERRAAWSALLLC